MIELVAAVEKVTVDKEGHTKLTLSIPLQFLNSVNQLISENKAGGKNFALAMKVLDNTDIANHTQLIDDEEFLNP